MKLATVLCVAVALLAVAHALRIDAVKKHRRAQRLEVRQENCPESLDVIHSRPFSKTDPNGKGLAFNEWAAWASDPMNSPELVKWAKAYREWQDICAAEIVKPANGGQVGGAMRLVLTPLAYTMYQENAGALNLFSDDLAYLGRILFPPDGRGAKVALLPAAVTTEPNKEVPLTYLWDKADMKAVRDSGIFIASVRRWSGLARDGTQPSAKWRGCKNV